MAEPPTAPAPDPSTADPPTPIAGWPTSPATPDEHPDATTGRRRRRNRWDRPKPPHDWRFWVGGLGRVLIVAGLLLLGFVAYQLWGTGIETARAQRGLESDFEELLANVPATTVLDEPGAASTSEPGGVFEPAEEDAVAEQGADAAEAAPTSLPAATNTTDEPADPAEDPALDDPAGDNLADDTGEVLPGEVVPVDQQLIPLVENGDALFRLEIPRIGTNDIVVAGVETADLRKGPGHFPETPLPGQLGNSAIAGHRTTYGQPFHNVDQLEPGDEMIVTTLSGTFIYVVTGQEIVSPSDYHVIATTDPTIATLTLTSCHPKWTAENRIIVHGILDPERSAAIGEPVLNYGQSVDVEAVEPADTVAEPAATDGVTGNIATEVDEDLVGVDALAAGTANAGTANAFTEGWFSDSGAYAQVALWAALLIAIWAGAYLLARHFRRTWLGVAVGILPFLVALFFFYQNVNRMLPPNL